MNGLEIGGRSAGCRSCRPTNRRRHRNLRRLRYQHGSLKIEKRDTGEDVWGYRWREYCTNGTSTYRKKIIGPASEFRTKTAAQRAVEGLKLDINATTSAVPVSHTVAELIAHYKQIELESGSICWLPPGWKSIPISRNLAVDHNPPRACYEL